MTGSDEFTTLPFTQTSTSQITSIGMSSSAGTTEPGVTTTIMTIPYVPEAGTNGMLCNLNLYRLIPVMWSWTCTRYKAIWPFLIELN